MHAPFRRARYLRHGTTQMPVRAHASEHLHFVCTDCGSISCLPTVTVAIRATGEAPRSVRAREVAVQLSGLCNGCAEHE